MLSLRDKEALTKPTASQIFTIRETHGRAERPENRLIAHSQDVGWRSLYAAIFEEAPLQTTESAITHPFVIYHLSRPTEVMRKIVGASRERALIGPRRMCVTPGEATTRWEHHGHPEILQVYIRQSVYSAAVNDMYGCDTSAAQIVPRFAIVDPLLEQLCIAIANALRDGTVEDGLYTDTLAQMIAVHLARYHCSRSRAQHSVVTRPIPSWKIRRLVDFIEENLDRDLSLAAMASEVAVSPLYLPRSFKAAVGQSPHQYVIRRRIERAKELLTSGDTPIVDVALSVGFSSQSHLSSWFLRLVGVSPAEYRRQSAA
jgi:AraC family transcriptional regulator